MRAVRVGLSLRRPGFCISSSGHRDPPVRYSLKSLSKEIVGRGTNS